MSLSSPSPYDPIQSEITALHLAASGGYIKLVRLLSKHGADLNAQDEDGWTPVYTTAVSEDIEEGVRVEVLKVLHELGANMNTPDNEGKTPVWAAAEGGCVEVVKALGELGADIVSSDEDGKTPLEVAMAYDTDDEMEEL